MSVAIGTQHLLPPLVIPVCDAVAPPRAAADVSGSSSAFREALRRRVEDTLNVAILAGHGTESDVLPATGTPCQLILPVSRWRLRDAVKEMRAFAADPARTGAVSANLVFDASTASYVNGRCPDFPMAVATARRRAWKATGFLPSANPAWDCAPDGTRTLTVHRSHYTLQASCSLADLERMLGALAHAELVGQRGASGALADVDSPDWRAIVLTPPAEPGTRVETCDDAHTRRLSYSAPRPLPACDTAVRGALTADALIDRAQVYAADCDRDRPDRWNWEPAVRPIKA